MSLSILEGWAAQTHAEGRRMKNRNGHGWPFHKWHFKTGSSVTCSLPGPFSLPHQSSSLAHTLSLTQPSALPRLEEVIFKQVSSLWPEMDNRGRIQANVYAIQVPATTSRELLAEVGETGKKDHKGKSVFSGSTSARKHCRISPRCIFLSHVPLNFTCSAGQRAENPFSSCHLRSKVIV